jgi:PAS domain S-box-containing protein
MKSGTRTSLGKPPAAGARRSRGPARASRVAEEELRASQDALDAHRALLQAVFDAMPVWVFVKDRESRFLMVNRKLAADHGLSPEQYRNLALEDSPLPVAEEQDRFRAMDRQVMQSGEQMDIPEERVTLPSGHVSYRHTVKVPLRDGRGRITGIVCVSEEINDRKRAEADLRTSEERFRNLIEGSIQGVLVHRGHRPLFVNAAYARMFGFDSPEELLRMESLEQLIAPSDRDRLISYYESRLRGEAVPTRYVFQGIRRDGSPIWVETLVRVVDWEGGPAVQGTYFDITQQREGVERLRKSEERFRNLVEGSIQGIVVHRNHENPFLNEAFAKIFGYEHVAELLALPSLRALIAPRELERLVGYHRSRLQGKDAPVHYEWEGVRKDGSRVWLDAISRVVDWDGSPAVQTTLFDITERREAEERLRASEERFRNLVEGSIQGIVVHRNLVPLFLNQAFADIFGYTHVEELLAQPSLRVVIAPGDQERLFGYQRSRLEGGDAPAYYQFEGVRKDGSRVWLDAISRVVDWDGSPAVQTTLFDITRRKALEEQLRQSQKMEAIGKLAGGVAHDFNNLLQVIAGFTRLALSDVSPNQPLHRDLRMIEEAAQRAAGLTHQLLAFSRRQVLNPSELDLNDLVANMVRLLERLIEKHIQVTVIPGEQLSRIRADAGMIEQVLMNLCVNARDAMQAGGHVIIETRNVAFSENDSRQHPWARPGRFVMMAVTDTGVGITPEVREHIFEPFFTTKEIGKGTGLGLSTVYGIVQQHNGFILVDSIPGTGSTFRVYLPAADSAAPEMTLPKPPEQRGDGETILIVEDEPGVQGVAVRTLTRHGYRVLTARDGAEALEALRAHTGKIDLVLMDLIMPRMTGAESYRRLREAHPNVRVLFTTGSSASLPRDGDDPAPPVLHKPYSPEQLLASVRAMLDRP